MFYAFLKLQWKSFFRGESVGANVMTKIFKWFWIVYFSFITPMLGLITYKVLKEDFEIEDPFLFLNKNLIYVHPGAENSKDYVSIVKRVYLK